MPTMKKTASQIADEVLMKLAIADMPPEMEKHFRERTDRHIKLVQKYCKRLADSMPALASLVGRGKVHDASKYQANELLPYIWLTWRYKCQDDGTECKMPGGMEEKINAATEHHILNNSHHPEFHQDKKTGLINSKDRDAVPDEVVDATRMPPLDIAEMVADWCAMSEERGNTPKAWADKVVGPRWKFTEGQRRLIYALIDIAWRGGG